MCLLHISFKVICFALFALEQLTMNELTIKTTYLEANLEVIAELRAATQLTVEALIYEAVELIRAIAAVIIAVTQRSLVQTLPITAHEG